ncbi:hypothetical protein P167DRAFT_539648 [Morchella conica CCBAS932]|uniref:Uncharacterized protein n=1 Tax=Morchella conica CCBAS932 TaxID=1392247 RepID=A0A3N4KBQ9_9PEZI|nr:hypothetical protein P167DRAFT_539648 [Morchella conica CCBAS932]
MTMAPRLPSLLLLGTLCLLLLATPASAKRVRWPAPLSRSVAEKERFGDLTPAQACLPDACCCEPGFCSTRPSYFRPKRCKKNCNDIKGGKAEWKRRVKKVRNAEIARECEQEILKKAPKNTQPSSPPEKKKKTKNEQQKPATPPPGGDSKKKASTESFGRIVFAGPSNALSNMDSINAGSHWHFLTCETPGTSSKTRQTVRVICTTAGEADSNCDIIYEDGVEGTVVKVPRGCFEGDYAVLHGMVEAEDQSVPEGVKGGKVMEMTFDYNFGSVKETEEPVSFRIDFSNVPGYNDAMEGFGGI